MAAAPDQILCSRCNLPGCDLKVLGCGCHLHAVRFGVCQRTTLLLVVDYKKAMDLDGQWLLRLTSLHDAEVVGFAPDCDIVFV